MYTYFHLVGSSLAGEHFDGAIVTAIVIAMVVWLFMQLAVPAELEMTVGHQPFSNPFQGFGKANPVC